MLRNAGKNHFGRFYSVFSGVGAGISRFKEPLNSDDLRSGLREFVSKNKTLPDFFLYLTPDRHGHHPDVVATVEAIKQANVDAAVFRHPDADKYILYAVEKELVPFWSGMSAYNYVNALAQFTRKRNLKPGDKDVKSIRSMVIRPMFDDGQMTVSGYDFLDGLITFSRHFDAGIDFFKLRRSFKKLDLFDQQIMEVELHESVEGSREYGINNMLLVLSHNMPFCYAKNANRIVIPSYGVFNAILHEMEKSPLQMKPIFGVVSEQTRDEMHAKDQHPVTLYSSAVTSNIALVHNRRSGPIPNWLHDMGHVLWGTMLGFEGREFLNKEFAPFLRNKNSANNAVVHDFVEALLDYDLSPLNRYYNKAQRFKFMLQTVLSKVYKAHPKHGAKAFKNILLPAVNEWLEANPEHSKHEAVAGLKQRIRIHVDVNYRDQQFFYVEQADERLPDAQESDLKLTASKT